MLRLMIPTLTPTRAQVLMALELVSGEGNGRVALGAKLGIGEGVVRTLIKHLLAEGLVEVSTRGVRGFEKGGETPNGYTRRYPEGYRGTCDRGHRRWMRLHRAREGGASRVRLGIEQRDATLLANAKGATTITFVGGRASIPGMDRNPSKPFVSFLEENFKPEDGDAVIVGTGDTDTEAQIGVYAAALSLI